MIKKFSTLITFILIYSNVFPQLADTLFVEISQDQINKTVFINQIDINGDSIKSPHISKLVFLFTNQELLKKLKYKNHQKEEYPNRIVGHSASPPQYGIQLNNYQLDSVDFQPYFESISTFKKMENNLKKFDNKNEYTEDIQKFENNMFKTLNIPLKDLFVNQKYLKDKSIFIYTGTKKNYEDFQVVLEKHRYIFVIIPYDFSEIYSYKYHLKQVTKSYNLPGL